MATVLTNSGRAQIVNRIMGTGTVFKWVHWGTGAGTAAVADTTLFTPASEARAVGAESQVTTTVTNDTYRVIGTLTADAGKTITNAGTFDALTSGNLITKGDFTGLALNLNDSIEFTVDLKIA